MVVHFSPAEDSHAVSGYRKDGNGVSKICLKEFLKNAWKTKALRVGGATTARSDPPEDVIGRAEYLLEDGFGDYNLFRNNCEVFGLYCRTGLVIQGTRFGQVASATSVPFSLCSFASFIAFPFLRKALTIEAPVILGFVAVASSAALLIRIVFKYTS